MRQSGGAGSGGKPDKAGAELCCPARTFLKVDRRKGYKSGVPPLYPSFRAEGYRTACCLIARRTRAPMDVTYPFGRCPYECFLFEKCIPILGIFIWVLLDAYH